MCSLKRGVSRSQLASLMTGERLKLRSCVATLLAWACLVALPAVAAADDFELTIEVKCDSGEFKTEFTEEQPSEADPHVRPVLHVKQNEELHALWLATNTGANETWKDVLIHFFVVAEERAGQTAVPELGKDVVHEGALTMDFEPADKASGQFTLAIPESGSYLIRIETQGMLDAHGHEHYAALDLIVDEADPN